MSQATGLIPISPVTTSGSELHLLALLYFVSFCTVQVLNLAFPDFPFSMTFNDSIAHQPILRYCPQKSILIFAIGRLPFHFVSILQNAGRAWGVSQDNQDYVETRECRSASTTSPGGSCPPAESSTMSTGASCCIFFTCSKFEVQAS